MIELVLVLAVGYAAGYATRGFIGREVKALGAELAKERAALMADLNGFFAKMRIAPQPLAPQIAGARQIAPTDNAPAVGPKPSVPTVKA